MKKLTRNVSFLRKSSFLSNNLLPRESFKPIMIKDYKEQQFKTSKQKLLKDYVNEINLNNRFVEDVIYKHFLSRETVINCLDNTFIPGSLTVILDESHMIGILKNKHILFKEDACLKLSNEELNIFVKSCLNERKRQKSAYNYQNFEQKVNKINNEMNSDLKILLHDIQDSIGGKDEANYINLISDANKSLFPGNNTINAYLITGLKAPMRIAYNQNNEHLFRRLIGQIFYLL